MDVRRRVLFPARTQVRLKVILKNFAHSHNKLSLLYILEGIKPKTKPKPPDKWEQRGAIVLSRRQKMKKCEPMLKILPKILKKISTIAPLPRQ
jgi:hypothetical protein